MEITIPKASLDRQDSTQPWLARGAKALAITVYALVFGEVFVRLLAPVPIMPRYVTGAPYGVRVGMPNMDFWQTTEETRARIRTNARGLRADREIPYAKPTGVCRILLLGDSFFVGYEVNLQDSFAYLLQQRLQSNGYRCEVVNLAVSGFGTAEMLITLQNEGLRYQPDIVVFSSNWSDLDDNVRSSLYALDGQNRLIRTNSSFLPGIRVSDALSKFFAYRWVSENSQLYSALRERLAVLVKSSLLQFHSRHGGDGELGADNVATPTRSPSDAYAERLNLRLLQEGSRIAEANHAHFAVLEIPVWQSRIKFVRMLSSYDATTAAELHVYDSTPALLAAADPKRKVYFEKGQGHLSPLGNRILMEGFFNGLVASGWLPQPIQP